MLLLGLQDYQFWTQTDMDGNFTIKNAIPGVYGLHGWVTGKIGNYLKKDLVTISAGKCMRMKILYLFLPNLRS